MKPFATTQQAITSAETSINSAQLPAVFKRVKWLSGTVNADIGGGKFDNAFKHLASLGVINLVYDPYNRPEAHNREVANLLTVAPADTATCSNVLNVIAEYEARQQVIFTVSRSIRPGGVAYFTIYEGNKSGIGQKTSKGWQENRPTKSYIEEIKRLFRSVTLKNGVIMASNPIKTPA